MPLAPASPPTPAQVIATSSPGPPASWPAPGLREGAADGRRGRVRCPRAVSWRVSTVADGRRRASKCLIGTQLPPTFFSSLSTWSSPDLGPGSSCRHRRHGRGRRGLCRTAAVARGVGPRSLDLPSTPSKKSIVKESRGEREQRRSRRHGSIGNKCVAICLNPGEQIYEKLISGMYMWEIVQKVLLKMAQKVSLCANNAPPKLETPYILRCGPCKYMVPILKEVSEKLGDKIQVVKIGTEKYTSIISCYRIEALPTFIIFKDGKPCYRFEGALPAKQMIGQIENALAVMK